MPTEIRMTRISADNNVMRWTVTALAYAGTLPMIACVLWLEQPWSLPLLKAYSLAILAFLAGAWWAFALMNQKKVAPASICQILLLSNAAVITAIVSFVIADKEALLVFCILFGCLLLGERKLAVFRQQPDYYRRLRIIVTSITITLQLTAYGLTR